MGNTQPTNKTGNQQTQQKIENAKKLGIISLSEHQLNEIPKELYGPDIVTKLRVIDLSKNSLSSSLRLRPFVELKTLNLDYNQLYPGTVSELHYLNNLQSLSIANNCLGKHKTSSSNNPTKKKNGIVNVIQAKLPTATTKDTISNRPLEDQLQQQLTITSPGTKTVEILPELPVSLKQLNLSNNYFSSIPSVILSMQLTKLEKLDLSNNQLATVPDEISNLKNLEELKLDNNAIVILPITIGHLSKLKVLSLKNNQLRYNNNDGIAAQEQHQPIPKEIFVKTKLIDLNLHGNTNLTNTQLNQFDGYEIFLERRQKVKSKLLSNLDTCGLE